MKKYYISFLSAAIFIAYGLLQKHYIFVVLGIVFILIGIKDILDHKKD
ncbi:hypothetical protein [Streptococcus devriesei]|nr:hypothetical protein [Streptococcus devriesei]